MNEKVLQQVWRLQLYDQCELKTACGKTISIIFPGNLNPNAGPDFIQARIRIEETYWAGNVEIHVRASDWFKHDHQHDKNYSNVILHVVWENDLCEFDQAHVLALKERMRNYDSDVMFNIFSSHQSIPCLPYFRKEHLTIRIKYDLLRARLSKKALHIQHVEKHQHYDWAQVCWIMLCRSMGYSVNEDAFEQIALRLPYRLMLTYKHDLLLVESLLFGVSGLLDGNFTDEYPNLLKKQFHRLKAIHSLKSINVPLHFLRMRPMNFPTIRLAQLASIITNLEVLISLIMKTNTLYELAYLFENEPSEYWSQHYVFDKPSSFSSKKMGKTLIFNLLINTYIPVNFTRKLKLDPNSAYIDGIEMLQKIKPELNYIINQYTEHGITLDSAEESQALIELFNQFCSFKKCSECAVGFQIATNSVLN